MSFERDIELAYEVGCLRFVQRTWKRFLNADFQNVTEHTLRVIWLSLMIAKYEEVKDTEKIMKMALVHDLTESRTGDVDYLSRVYTKRMNEDAIKEIFKDTSLNDFVEIWEEYEKRECIESKIVKDADTLDIDFEIQEQFSKGNKVKDSWIEMRQTTYQTLHTKTARRIFESIQKSNPHDWHIKAKNRLNSGDWKEIKK